MTKLRYMLVTTYPEFFPLEEDELEAGWHFCREFDQRLIGPGLPEFEMCNCVHDFKEE